MNAPGLVGRRIVITRARQQAEALARAVAEQGGEVISLPLLEIRDASDGGAELRAGLESLSANDWLVVLSPNGARRVAGLIEPGSCKLAVVAAGTAAVLEDAGWTVDLLPTIGSADGLLESFADQTIDGVVLIAQAEGGRRNLADGLQTRGVDVRTVVAYRNVAARVDDAAVQRARGADTVVFTSPSAVERYVDAVGVVPCEAVCIGSVTATSARDSGFSVTVAAAPTTESLLAALSSR